jgi:hypothetical protein
MYLPEGPKKDPSGGNTDFTLCGSGNVPELLAEMDTILHNVPVLLLRLALPGSDRSYPGQNRETDSGILLMRRKISYFLFS